MDGERMKLRIMRLRCFSRITRAVRGQCSVDIVENFGLSSFF